MTFDFFEILLLSAIQGISEFIPVSSSAHLFLVSDIYNFKVQSLVTDIGLHLGSLLAIITYFHSDLTNIFKNKNLLFLITIGPLMLDMEQKNILNKYAKKESLFIIVKVLSL